MATTINRFETAILAGIADVITHWAIVPLPHVPLGDNRAHRLYHETTHHKWLAEQSIAAVNLTAFLGRPPTDSERTLATRAYKSLEGA
jgi:hypothetical protein